MSAPDARVLRGDSRGATRLVLVRYGMRALALAFLAVLLAFPLAAKFVVGTDIAHAAALLFIAGIGHLIAGNVDVAAMSWLLVGSIPGVLVGSQISVGLPERVLRLTLAVLLALSGLKLLDVPYADGLVLASLAGGLAALVVWGIVVLRQRLRAKPAPPARPQPRPAAEPRPPERRS